MAIDEEAVIKVDGHQSIGELRKRLYSHFAWALGTDYQQPEQCARFWYVSEEKLEPRLGERHSEPGAECEQPLDIGRQVAELNNLLKEWSDWTPVAHLLLLRPSFVPLSVGFNSLLIILLLKFRTISFLLRCYPSTSYAANSLFLEQLALILVLIAGFESACFKENLTQMN